MVKIAGRVLLLLIMAARVLVAESPSREAGDSAGNASGIVRLYNFDSVKDINSLVKNFVSVQGNLSFVSYSEIAYIPAEQEELNVDLKSLKVVEGREPGMKAVRLDRGFYQGLPVNIENRAFTAGAWFRIPASGEPASVKKKKSILSVGGDRQGWKLDIETGKEDMLIFCMGHTRGNSIVEAKTSFSEGKWHHVAASWDGSSINLFVDGKQAGAELSGKVVFPDDYEPSALPLRIGYSEDGEKGVPLDIDEIVIYNKALSAEEISAVFSKTEAVAVKGGMAE